MKDILPEEANIYRHIKEKLREKFELWGYKEVVPSTIEFADVLSIGIGSKLTDNMFKFQDLDGKIIALRAEATIPTARILTSELALTPKPIRLYYIVNVFRRIIERPGRFREFWQAGIELIGRKDPEADAEVLMILTEALKEASIVLWAGIGIHRLDTSGVDWTREQIEQIIRQHISQIKPGKHIATTARWDIQIVDLKPNIENLIATLEYLDQTIISAFQVPRFLLGREKEVNRATAYAELESFIHGPIRETQRWIKRELEAQWYNRLVKKFYGVKEAPQVKVRHIWKPIQTSDFIELLRSVAQAYGKGEGFLSKEKALELLNLSPG
ncbi:MAG: ATP phosphoribosyltransferase regulatory subunit [Candidatus Bathyarchaeia archaeon]